MSPVTHDAMPTSIRVDAVDLTVLHHRQAGYLAESLATQMAVNARAAARTSTAMIDARIGLTRIRRTFVKDYEHFFV